MQEALQSAGTMNSYVETFVCDSRQARNVPSSGCGAAKAPLECEPINHNRTPNNAISQKNKTPRPSQSFTYFLEPNASSAFASSAYRIIRSNREAGDQTAMVRSPQGQPCRPALRPFPVSVNDVAISSLRAHVSVASSPTTARRSADKEAFAS
jgi:hypothetical protein